MSTLERSAIARRTAASTRVRDGVRPRRPVLIWSDLGEPTAVRESDGRAASGASRDRLTGLLDRAAFDESVARLEREGVRPGSVIRFEVDHLDALERDHGRGIGEDAVAALGSILGGSFRSGDLVARIDDTTLVAVLPGVPIGQAARRAEGIRSELQATRLRGPFDEPVSVSASAGCAVLGHGPGAIAASMERAAEALATARRAGSNRVIASR